MRGSASILVRGVKAKVQSIKENPVEIFSFGFWTSVWNFVTGKIALATIGTGVVSYILSYIKPIADSARWVINKLFMHRDFGVGVASLILPAYATRRFQGMYGADDNGLLYYVNDHLYEKHALYRAIACVFVAFVGFGTFLGWIRTHQAQEQMAYDAAVKLQVRGMERASELTLKAMQTEAARQREGYFSAVLSSAKAAVPGDINVYIRFVRFISNITSLVALITLMWTVLS
jgi:hypothetical protein